MDKINATIEKLNGYYSDFLKKMQEQKDISDKKAQEVIEAARGEISHISDAAQIQADNADSHIQSELIKAQMTFNSKKDELKAKISQIKADSEQKKAQFEVEASAEYAYFTISLATQAIDEAVVAFLEAVEIADEYERKYSRN